MTINPPTRAGQLPLGVVLAVAMVVGGCSGALPGPSQIAETVTPTAALAPTASPATSTAPTAVAVRPGLILFEHFGNAADGTPLSDNDRRHLWLVKADGSDLRELVPDVNMGEGGHAAWAPDGVHIAFDGSVNAIFETDVDTRTGPERCHRDQRPGDGQGDPSRVDPSDPASQRDGQADVVP
jgi:hypothetical protein